MTDIPDLSNQEDLNTCPEEGCETIVETTNFQGLPVVNCPKLGNKWDVWMQGQPIPEELKDDPCPLIERVSVREPF